jgi:hypothetical protein
MAFRSIPNRDEYGVSLCQRSTSTNWCGRMSIRADRSRFRFLIAIAAGFLGAAVLAIGLTVWWLRADEIGDATRDTGNLATVLAEQTNLAVQSIDLVLNEIQERLENLGARTQDNFGHLQQDKNTYHSLTDSLSHLSQAALIALIDKNGRVVTTTQKWPTPTIDLTNRDYFQHFKNNDDKGIYVGKPVADHCRFRKLHPLDSRSLANQNIIAGCSQLPSFLSAFYATASSRDDGLKPKFWCCGISSTSCNSGCHVGYI